ncbi:MAG: metallophosphoesterase [Deltaproteobacteria bacterium]|nr:metallophosphoesterase [Deltaproteobacteria bacterium]
MSSRRSFLAGAVGAALTSQQARARERRDERREERVRQSWGFTLEEVELQVPGLHPAHDGLRVGQLTDIHVGANTPDGRIIAAVDALNHARPDLVVLTGDYVTRKGDPLERVPELLSRLEGDVVAVLGNHDHWTDAPTLKRDLGRVGFCVLQNQNTLLRVRGAPLCVVGVDDGVTGRADVAAALRGAPTGGSRLVLAHTPPTVEKLPADAGLVCLSGHTHGGQIWLGSVTEGLFARAGQPYVRGHYRVGNNSVYVSRGLGLGRGSPLLRVGADPEVTLLTLRAA